MHLFYIDESGDDGRTPNATSHFVLGGLVIHDSQWRRMTKRVESIALRHLEHDALRIELHGSDMLSGRGPYRSIPAEARESLFHDLLAEIGQRKSRLSLFFVVVHKPCVPITRDVRLVAILQLCERFNSYLTRVGAYQQSTRERGMLICDEHASQKQIRSLVAAIHSTGFPRQLKNNLIETAFFADSHSSRMIQLADVVCHAAYRFVTAHDDRHFHLIERKVDRGKDGQPPHELVHYGFRYIATRAEVGLHKPLPFRHLRATSTTALPRGSFLPLGQLEEQLQTYNL